MSLVDTIRDKVNELVRQGKLIREQQEEYKAAIRYGSTKDVATQAAKNMLPKNKLQYSSTVAHLVVGTGVAIAASTAWPIVASIGMAAATNVVLNDDGEVRELVSRIKARPQLVTEE